MLLARYPGQLNLEGHVGIVTQITHDYIPMTRYPGCSSIVSEVYSRESRGCTEDDVAIRRCHESKGQFSLVGAIVPHAYCISRLHLHTQ
jgi:hypothetical protein